MEINITTFTSLPTTGKVPLSPYNDKTFIFNTQLIQLEDVHYTFSKDFVLSSPIIQSTKPILRNNETLQPLQITENSNYVILDFDKVNSIDDVNYIIEYFKNNNFSINIFKSKSFNTLDAKRNITSYNIKAVLLFDSTFYKKTDKTKTYKDIKEAIVNYLTSILGLYCEVDISSTRYASYQAPTNNNDCLFFNEGRLFNIDISDFFIETPTNTLQLDFSLDVTQWFYNYLLQQGATFKNTTKQIVNVSLPIEVKSKFGYYWDLKYPYLLQHPQKSKSINMFPEFIKSDEGKKYIKVQHLKTLKSAFENLPGYKFSSRYFNIDEESSLKTSNIVDSFIKNGQVLVIKGAMGTGKSSVIENFIEKQSSRVLLISMRRSLALDMSDKYKIKNYLDDLNTNNKNQYKPGDSLVIQIDSLYKINPNDFDYCIIDEFESLCLYVDSNLKNSQQYVKNVKYLKDMFEKKIIIADAFINELTLNLHFKGKKTSYITNTYKDTCKVYVYEHKQTFITFLEQTAIRKQTDEFVVCSFGTLAELFSVEKLLKDHGLRVISITSETSDEAKEIMYKLFKEKHHNKYDIILFSPTITVGVSILNNVKHHFHYDSGKSIDPISSIQMLKRSRTVENVHVFIKGKQMSFKSYDVNYLNEIVTKNIKDYLNDSRNIVFYNTDTDSLSNLGMFVNTFVAHSNFFSNDHENTFKFLLTQQFENIRVIEEDIPHHKFEQYRKEINCSNSNLCLFDDINKVKDLKLNYEISEINYLENKRRNEDEERELIFLKVKSQLPFLDDDQILDITKFFNKDQNYINKLQAMEIFLTKRNDIDDIITDYTLNNISLLFSKESQSDYIKLLKYIKFLNEVNLNVNLQDSYSINDLKALNEKYTKNNINFSWFIGKMGYVYKNSTLTLPYNFKKHISWILKYKL